MKKLASILLVGALSAFARADQVSSTKFKGLNNYSNSVIINADEAQDMLNVDVSVTGQSVKKRSGYGLYKALSTAKPMHGGFHSYDSSGNDVQVWGSSTSLYGIVGGATPTQLISSATLNSTWDCVDTQQNSYCVDSNRDAYIKTNGTTMLWYASPLGTMVEATPDRVVVAGVAASPNTLFVSQSNTFTNYTTGILPTDAFTEPIAAPGSKLTHIKWGCGKLLWWKDQSFGYFDFDDQYVAQVKTVSDNIGTLDNTSAIDPGGNVWFRGQDGHTWKYDCSILSKESIDITPNVQASGKRIANSWTQTTLADWQAGLFMPSGNFSTTVNSGDVSLSSYTVSDTLTTSSMTYSSAQLDNNSFESGQTTNWTAGGAAIFSNVASLAVTCGTISPQDGTKMEQIGSQSGLFARVLSYPGLVVISSAAFSYGGSECSWTLNTIPTPGAYIGKTAKLQFSDSTSDTLTSDVFVLNGNSVQFYLNKGHTTGPSINYSVFDLISNSPKASQAAATSSVFDSAITSTTVQVQSTWNTAAAPTFSVQTSSANPGTFTSILTSTGTNATGQRYFRYISTFTFSSSDSLALATVSSQTIVAVSTGGIFLSAVHNAPSLTAWSSLGVNSQNAGGTHTLYMRASNSSFAQSAAAPAWTAQTSGSLISISTGAYFQFRDDFVSSYSTAALALNDFTVNWFEGSASDQAYMIYFDNAIWQSVAFGAGQSVNNYIFKFDLINQGWTVYNFGAGGMLVQANTLYFGDTAAGNVYNYGTGTSDNGTAINAYWKSKDFSGQDPFLQTQLTNIDTFAKTNQGTTLTAAYTLDTSTTTSYSMSLTNSTQSVVQSRKILPTGKLGQVFNVKYSDTSASSAWEILGYRIGFTQLPYRAN